MRSVYIAATAQIPVKKSYELSLRELGASVAIAALEQGNVEEVDALYVSNMLSDELQCQKHVAALIADESGLIPVEALQVRAAMASGAAALRIGFLAIASGQADHVLIVGVEKMSDGPATQSLAKALDSEKEMPDGATMISQVATLTRAYLDHFQLPEDALSCFSVNAHENAKHNPFALFNDRQFSPADVMSSRVIMPPIRLLDCAPICDGAAAVLLTSADNIRRDVPYPVRILSSAMATDRFRLKDRAEPLTLMAAKQSAEKAYRQAALGSEDVDLFEVHDAFSTMSCLALEAAGFASPGQGWRLAAESQIALDGRIPLSTMGGLKARGHPIGATALYQVCEIVQQLTGQAGPNQVPGAEVALMQSIGGVGTSVLTHIIGLS